MITVIEILALAVIIWYSACGLNHMTRSTRRAVVLAVSILFAGAVARVWLLFTTPAAADPSAAAILVAFAIGMLTNRRRNHNCPCLPSFSSRHDKGAHA